MQDAGEEEAAEARGPERHHGGQQQLVRGGRAAREGQARQGQVREGASEVVELVRLRGGGEKGGVGEGGVSTQGGNQGVNSSLRTLLKSTIATAQLAQTNAA